MNIYIVFESADLERIQNVVTPIDLIIGDIGSKKSLACKLVKPYLDKHEEEKLSSNVQSFFDEYSIGYFAHIKGFSNIFYEATVLPVASYICTLQNACTQYTAAGFSIKVIFPSGIINKTERSVLFLAEHEAQRRFLYKRQLIFQPYLERFCKNHNILIAFVAGSVISHSFFTLPLRRLITLFLRFCRTGIKIVYGSLTWNTKVKEGYPDFIAVTRLARKSEFLEPILTKAGLQAELIVAENFVNLNSNWSFCHKYFGDNTGTKKILTPSIGYFFVTYLRSFLHQGLKLRKCGITIEGITINCKNALLEVLVSYPDLLLYTNALTKTLQRSNSAKHAVMLSLELKSPYAYADAMVAHNFGYACFHVMDCDQLSHPLPKPVFGDLFITNTNSAKDAFKCFWGNDSEKVVFWGNLSQMNLKLGVKKDNEHVWCFFTSDRLEENLPVMEKIVELQKQYGIQLIVKLHPRDKAQNYKKFREIRVITDEDIARNDLFRLFAFGLTFSSAVVHDLMLYQKQFLIVKNVAGSNFNRSAHSEKYEKLVIHYNDIVDAVLHVKNFREYFDEYNKQYLEDVAFSGDLNTFKDNLLSWQTQG